ncbi:MAG: hypothetical protein ABIP29_11495, partial [Candidatus Eisenbacteria bacterium]
VDGFRALPLLEDLDLAVRLRARRRVIRLLDAAVVSSARRLRAGGLWRGGMHAWRLVRDFHARRPLDRAAVKFYAAQAPER